MNRKTNSTITKHKGQQKNAYYTKQYTGKKHWATHTNLKTKSECECSRSKLFSHDHCLTASTNQCHRSPRICSVCSGRNRVILFSFMTCHRIFDDSSTTHGTSGAETAWPYRALEFAFIGVRIVHFVLMFLGSSCDIRYNFQEKSTSIILLCKGNHVLFIVIVFIYLYHNSHFRVCSCRLAITWRVPLLEQKLIHPYFSSILLAQSLVLCVVACRSLFVILIPFLLAIELFFLLQMVASSYPFGIFKLLIQ